MPEALQGRLSFSSTPSCRPPRSVPRFPQNIGVVCISNYFNDSHRAVNVILACGGPSWPLSVLIQEPFGFLNTLLLLHSEFLSLSSSFSVVASLLSSASASPSVWSPFSLSFFAGDTLTFHADPEAFLLSLSINRQAVPTILLFLISLCAGSVVVILHAGLAAHLQQHCQFVV